MERAIDRRFSRLLTRPRPRDATNFPWIWYIFIRNWSIQPDACGHILDHHNKDVSTRYCSPIACGTVRRAPIETVLRISHFPLWFSSFNCVRAVIQAHFYLQRLWHVLGHATSMYTTTGTIFQVVLACNTGFRYNWWVSVNIIDSTFHCVLREIPSLVRYSVATFALTFRWQLRSKRELRFVALLFEVTQT